MISGLFGEFDRKITLEWDAINRQISESGDNENLSDEMKTESILRQLTYSTVSLVSALLDYQQLPGKYCIITRHTWHSLTYIDSPRNTQRQREQSLWKFIIGTPQVLEPILMFCKNTIRVRDTRCVALVVRVLRSTLVRFQEKSPIRDFYCIDILQAAITSLHEPYFVDIQKDLAGLIAAIIHLDEDIPRSIIMSLPGMPDKAYRVDRKLAVLRGANQSERMQRSVVLDLLSSVRGVSIHEQGKIERTKPKKKTAVQEQYMSVDEQPTIIRGTSPGLAGVADMFS